MSLSFNKNSNPVLTPELVKILRDESAFNTSNVEIGETLVCENFFNVVDQDQNYVGFVFFKQDEEGLEVLLGKYKDDIKGFTDLVLKNIPSLLSQINLEGMDEILVMNVIKVKNKCFEYLLKTSYLNDFKGQFDESQEQISNQAQKKRQDPEYGENVTLMKKFILS